MSLTNALIDRSSLRPFVVDGCGAIAAGHRESIKEELKKSVRDSLDLDEATRPEHGQANRWDYVLALRDNKTLIGLEPHSARDDEIETVIAKKERSAEVLRAHLKPGWYIAAWIWVSSGRVRFSRMDPAIRRLNSKGIKFVGNRVNSFEA
jgi:hypothetical protein